jgi:predicted nucleic-acid-binding protein
MRAIDTDVLLCLVIRKDAQRVRTAQAFIANGAWVSHLVLAETCRALSTAYGCNDHAIETAVEMLLDHRELTVQDPESLPAALHHYALNPDVGLFDKRTIEVARLAGHTPLGTFDRNLSRLDGAQRL